MRILTERTITTATSYQLMFWLKTDHPQLRGRGASFDCDKNGIVDEDALRSRPAAFANYQEYRSGKVACMVDVRYLYDHKREEYVSVPGTGTRMEVQVRTPYVEERAHRHTEPAVGLCQCGRKVTLSGFTNTCDCGRDYDMSGQLLADRRQWGEETGETLADILAVA
jgi:hypothetical protein